MRDNLTMGTRRKLSPKDGAKGHFIAEWLKKSGMTQEQLAAEAGYGTSSINQLIKGKQGYSQVTLEALAPVFGCEPWQLVAVNPFDETREIDRELAEKALRSSMIAFGVDRGQLDRAVQIVSTFVVPVAVEERSEQNQSDDQSQPASRRRATAPSA